MIISRREREKYVYRKKMRTNSVRFVSFNFYPLTIREKMQGKHR